MRYASIHVSSSKCLDHAPCCWPMQGNCQPRPFCSTVWRTVGKACLCVPRCAPSRQSSPSTRRYFPGATGQIFAWGVGGPQSWAPLQQMSWSSPSGANVPLCKLCCHACIVLSLRIGVGLMCRLKCLPAGCVHAFWDAGCLAKCLTWHLYCHTHSIFPIYAL